MPLELPESITVVGQIEIALVLSEDGDTGVEFGHDGMSREAAIGHLMTVTDRLREEARFSWGTCPGCGKPWDEHDEEDDEEEDDPDE